MKGYSLLDAGRGRKFEQIGNFRVVRPSPAAVWSPLLSEWTGLNSEYLRYESGQGEWKNLSQMTFGEEEIEYGGIQFLLKPTSFGHLGLFAEQLDNWKRISQETSRFGKSPLRLLNLFAYTGGSTLAAAMAGAEVLHLDASKGSVDWAKANAELNGLGGAPIRWIVDDAMVFVRREVRRGNKYDAFVLDPPTYGKGAKNQVWKIDEHLIELLELLKQLRSPNFQFISLSSHSPGYTPLALENLLREFANDNFVVESEEMVVRSEGGLVLPSGATAFARRSF